jgi:hypothetical protein
VDVNLFVANVVIAAKYQPRAFLTEFEDAVEEVFQPAHLELLPFIATCTGRVIGADDGQVAKIGAQKPAFIVIPFDPHATNDSIGRLPTEDGHTAVSFLLCRKKMRLVPDILKGRGGELIGL